MLPFGRNTLLTLHHAQSIDLDEFKWLLKYGTTEFWYEKPSKAMLKRMERAELAGHEPDELLPTSARPSEIQTPKVWAPAALTTPTNEDIHECTAGHMPEQAGSGYISTCEQCTDEKSEALEATGLAYYLVFSSSVALDRFAPGSVTTGSRLIYKLVKCGSRAAAIADIFHTTGLNGWNLVFSCVMRASESIEDRGGKFRRVERLWMLANAGDDDGKSVRVFY